MLADVFSILDPLSRCRNRQGVGKIDENEYHSSKLLSTEQVENQTMVLFSKIR